MVGELISILQARFALTVPEIWTRAPSHTEAGIPFTEAGNLPFSVQALPVKV